MNFGEVEGLSENFNKEMGNKNEDREHKRGPVRDEEYMN